MGLFSDLRKFKESLPEEPEKEAYPLWDHQKAIIEKAKPWDYFGIFADIGTGKSACIVNIAEDKYALTGRVLKTLVFAPPVVLENLKREFKKFGRLSKDKVIVLTGTMEKRLKKFTQSNTTGYIFITNYEALYHKPLYTAFKAWHPEMVIYDESHMLKDYSSRRARCARDLADVCKYKYIMSGTPVLNSQLDLFSQIRILDGGKTFGKNDVLFRSQYFYNANDHLRGTFGYFPNWLPRPGINKTLQALIEPFTATAKKSEVLTLPPFIQKDQICEMGPKQEKAYREMEEDFVTYLNSQACVAELAITKSLRLSQILSGYLATEDGKEESFDDVPRLEALRGIIESTFPHKMIIWCVFKKNYEVIARICKELNIETCALTGETKNKRQEQIDLFQAERGPRIMIANPGAGGIGINLTAASYMVYYSKSFNLGHDMQSEGRNYRGGSEVHEKITRIDLVTPNTIDDLITKALRHKKAMGDEILRPIKVFDIIKGAYGTRQPTT